MPLKALEVVNFSMDANVRTGIAVFSITNNWRPMQTQSHFNVSTTQTVRICQWQ